MEKKSSSSIVKRILKIAIYSQIIITTLVFIFTKQIIYSIITLLASGLGIFGFIIMTKLLDRYLKKGRGKGLFFFVAFFKIILISVIFYPISHISESAVLFYIQGLSIIVFATMVEGMIQLIRNLSSGRT